MRSFGVKVWITRHDRHTAIVRVIMIENGRLGAINKRVTTPMRAPQVAAELLYGIADELATPEHLKERRETR